jgi:glycosyltransferase involved in cell wall biosynthesis
MGVRAEALALPESLERLGDSGFKQQGLPGPRSLWKVLRAAKAAHGYGRQLAQAVERIQPDVVHVTGLKMQILAAIYLAGRAKVLWHIHDYVSWRPLVRPLLSLLAGRCHGALANSNSVAEDLRRSCPSLPWVERFYNAVDVTRLRGEEAADLDHAAGVETPPSTTLRIGLVATYAHWKGQETYLKALAKLPAQPEWRAYIVGGPIYRTAGSQHTAEGLKLLIEQLGLTGRVHLTGFLPGRGAIMKALDIVVHASTKPEPFGMVVVEAMACGRAVIVSRAGGATELFSEGKTALGHEPGNALELAEKIAELLGNPDLRRGLGERGAAHVESSFHPAALAAQLNKIYERIRQRNRQGTGNS